MLERFGENLPAHEVKFTSLDLKAVEVDGTFSGYASVFGEVDLGKDLVERGAFREVLAARRERASGCCSSTTRRADRRLEDDPRGRRGLY